MHIMHAGYLLIPVFLFGGGILVSAALSRFSIKRMDDK